MFFSENFPSEPPKVYFNPPIFHPNIYPSGEVCLSILGPDWDPSISLKGILTSIQILLNEPNPSSPANLKAFISFTENPEEYSGKIQDLCKKMPFHIGDQIFAQQDFLS